MARPKCDLCNDPSVVHETVLGPSGPTVRHFCLAHGGPVWTAALPPARPEERAAFQKLIEEFGRRGRKAGG
jgi:hypothetical protein